MGHYQHPVKCMSCGLHFVVCSWQADWDPQPVCTECGSDALMRWAPLELDKEIFEVVPGQQPLISMPQLGGA